MIKKQVKEGIIPQKSIVFGQKRSLYDMTNVDKSTTSLYINNRGEKRTVERKDNKND